MSFIKKFALTYYRAKLAIIAIASPRKAAQAALKIFCTPASKNSPYPIPPIFNEAKKLSFEQNDCQIHGFRWKPQIDNGNKILVCHGFEGRTYGFYEFIQPLLNEGFEVIAFDAPGHGLSSGNQITMPVYQQMVLEIHKKFGPVDGIMGHSLGGLSAGLALEKIQDHQHKRLVLIAPATESTRAIETFFTHIKVSERVKKEFEKLIVELGGYPSSWYSVPRIMQQITTPTLWIHDQEDTITPFDDMKHMIEMQLPHLEFEITKGLGHSLYRNKEVAVKIVAFLARLKHKNTIASSSAI